MKPRACHKLINIIGIDGAGKTTLAKGMAKDLAKTDPRMSYVYAQYFAKLLWPFKKAAQIFFMTNTDEFREYTVYNKKKQGASLSHPRLSMVYGALWVMDYIIQVFFKVTLRRLMGGHMVLDRYIFDIAVNLSLTLGREKRFAKKLAHLLLIFTPAPDRVILIDLPEAVAWGRKGDIQDPYYLAQRRERYLYLAKAFNFCVIDGSKSVNQVFDQALAALKPFKDPEVVDDSKNGAGQPDHRKTILYVHANNEDVGGADYCLFKLASTLDRSKFRPVVCLSKKTAVLDLYEKAGIKTRVIPMIRIQKRLNPFYLLHLIGKFHSTVGLLQSIIRQERVDLVHGNDLLDIYGPVAARFEKVASTQYVRWIMVSPVWMKKIITAFVYWVNDQVMTVSQGVALAMFSKKGNILPKVRVCYDWLDMDAVGHSTGTNDIRKELGIEATIPLVGCVGRLEEWKGQDLFIRAAAQVAKTHEDARFIVVGGQVKGRGRTKFGQHCHSLAWALNMDKKMVFTGHRKDMSAVMESLDILVHASRTPDPLPGVVMEAMAAGLPVVGADAGGVPEEMADKKTGLLYEPGNSYQMAEKMTYLLDHPRQAHAMGRAGKKRVAQVFNKTIHCRRIENLYISMISNSTFNKATIFKSTEKGDSHVQNISTY